MYVVYNISMLKTVEKTTGPNIALDKPAEQFPDKFHGGSAFKALDGNTSDNAVGEMCAQTAMGTQSNPAWWLVDLKAHYNLTGIKIYNRNQNG